MQMNKTPLYIVPLPDLLRGARAFPEGFFDLVREPILQGVGIDIGIAPGAGKAHALLPGFDLAYFRALAGVDIDSADQQAQWAASYHQVSDGALEYLFHHLPPDCILLSFEMPPWLTLACVERRINFIDLRPSPLRFGRDLYVALRCSNWEVFRRISVHSVPNEEVRLEASILAANVRMHRRRLEDARGYRFDDLAGGLIFVGQTPFDASRLSPCGQSLRCSAFAERLQKLCKGRRLFHKAHPFALEFAEQERIELQRITGQVVNNCQHNAYQILSTHDDVELVGISSGLLQEAPWFDKRAHVLSRLFVPLATADDPALDAYQQIHFQTFLSPAFWHQILAPQRPAPRLASLPLLAHHHARETLDHWWDYSKVITWERTLPYEAFMRSGGAQFRGRIGNLESQIGHRDVSHGGTQAISSSSGDASRELLISLYSRLADGYLCADEVLKKNTSPDIYQGKALDADYYQSLHENNPLFQANNWLLPYLEFIRGRGFASIREIGCGNGAFLSAISTYVDRAVGLDWAKSPSFPDRGNISFQQKDITSADLEFFDLNCSADVLEHIDTDKLPALIESLHQSARYNFHVIACYDDGHSHLSILPPDAWLYLFRRLSPSYRIFDFSMRRDNASQIICVVTNL